MASNDKTSNNAGTKEYEKFGLYPFDVLQSIVNRLRAGEYQNSLGHPLAETSEFLELEKMAYEPPIPDPVTAAVAAIINYLEDEGYQDEYGQKLSDSPFILPLKQMNVRKMFRSQSDGGLRLLQDLSASSYSVSEEDDVRRLEDDPAFHDLRRIIILEGGEGRT